MSKPLVSVVIPTYNSAHVLFRAIKSVLGQKFQAFELIVVDDGSTDKTKDVVDAVAAKDKRVKYVWQPNSGGAAKPKNRGIRMALGEYIAFLDSDDEWLPEKLEEQIKLFEGETSGRPAFVGCGSMFVDEIRGCVYLNKIKRYRNVLDNILIWDYMGSGSTTMYRRKVFEEAGLFDEKLKHAQDWEMRIRLCQKYSFDFVDKPMVKYYFHGSNITNTISPEGREIDLAYIYRKWYEVYKKSPVVHSRRITEDGRRQLFYKRYKVSAGYFFRAIAISPIGFFIHLFSCFVRYQNKIAGCNKLAATGNR